MMGRGLFLLYGCVFLLAAGTCFAGPVSNSRTIPVRIAVEFMDHAAAAYVARDKGWFRAAGLDVQSYESYASGMALAVALARGGIDAAYICLVPAINARVNAGVPIKIVAGTHRQGYGLAVNGKKIRSVTDLEQPEIHIGCVREGGAVDVLLLHRVIDNFRLNPRKVLSRVRRMMPAHQLLAVETGRLDAVFMPEQWATMAEAAGFTMLLTTRDVWPGMDVQGSVLVVKEALIREHPDIVRKLVAVLEKATGWLNHHRREAAAVVARQLRMAGGSAAGMVPDTGACSAITPEVILRSMNRMSFTTAIDPRTVQCIIDYMAGLGYIKKGVKAGEILDMRFSGKGGRNE